MACGIILFGGVFFVSHDDDSKTATDVLYDIAYHNSDPVAVGLLSFGVASFAGIEMLPALLTIAGAAALVTDYGWNVYDKQDFITLPGSVEMLRDAAGFVISDCSEVI